jgi:hypothetical protein
VLGSALYTLCDGKTSPASKTSAKKAPAKLSGGKREARPHRQISLPDLDQPQRLSHRRGYVPLTRRGIPLLQSQRAESCALIFMIGITGIGTSSTSAPAKLTRATTIPLAPNDFVPNANGKDPEQVNQRYHLRGNGEWTYQPDLRELQSNGADIFRINSANVMTTMSRRGRSDCKCSISTDGRNWSECRCRTRSKK